MGAKKTRPKHRAGSSMPLRAGVGPGLFARYSSPCLKTATQPVRQFFVASGLSTALFAGNGTKTRLLIELAAIECEVPAGCAGCPVVGVVTAATLGREPLRHYAEACVHH